MKASKKKYPKLLRNSAFCLIFCKKNTNIIINFFRKNPGPLFGGNVAFGHLCSGLPDDLPENVRRGRDTHGPDAARHSSQRRIPPAIGRLGYGAQTQEPVSLLKKREIFG